MITMLNCKETSQLASQSLDRELTRKERFALGFHQLICKACRRFGQQLNSLNVILKQLKDNVENDTSITISSSGKKRIAELIDSSTK